jgi:predicted  nucleic acid-binding Zn-ribbon protein
MDQDLISYLDEQFRALREESRQQFEKIDGRFAQMDSRFEQIDSRFERVEESIRHTQVVMEGLHDEVRLVAEAFIGLDEKLGIFRAEVAGEFNAIRSTIRVPFENLDRRLRFIEEQPTRDAMAMIREKYGRGAV